MPSRATDCPIAGNMIATTDSIPVSQPIAPQTDPARLVSIVIPCYGGEPFLAEAIESCLAQTYRDFELIIVDDASPDRCLAIAERYAQADSRIRIVKRSQNGGVARAFNSGFEVARGEYLTRLAQDDAFEPHALEAMVGALHGAEPAAGLVYCDSVSIDSAGTPRKVDHCPEPDMVLRFGNRVGLCVLWTRGVWDSVGGFDPECDAAEDYDYWLRVAERFRLVHCAGAPPLRVRTHPQMGSIRSADRQVASTFRAVRKSAEQGLLSRSGWRGRQAAWASAHLTAMYAYSDQQRYGLAAGHLLCSLFRWPFQIPSAINSVRFVRIRLLGNIVRRLGLSIVSRGKVNTSGVRIF